MPTKRRYPLKTKESKQILTELSGKTKLDLEALFGTKTNVEVAETDGGLIYLIDGKPCLFKSETGEIIPILTFKEFTDKAPKIVVDMGAVPYVCKGADVMRPGIVRFDGEFAKDDLVLVVDVKFGKALAVGESLYSSAEAAALKKGPVVKTKHFVSDKIWNEAKTLIE